jgi:hypothetical protein
MLLVEHAVQNVEGGSSFCTTHESEARELWKSIWQEYTNHIQEAPSVFKPNDSSIFFVHPAKSEVLTPDVLKNIAFLRYVERSWIRASLHKVSERASLEG